MVNDDDIYITFPDGVQSTASTPTLTYTPGTIADLLLSNAALAFGPTVTLDRAGPAIVLVAGLAYLGSILFGRNGGVLNRYFPKPHYHN